MFVEYVYEHLKNKINTRMKFMTMKNTSWYKTPDFSKLEEELTTVDTVVDQKAPKTHKVGSTKVDEIKRKIGNQLDQAHAGTCGFVRGAVQDTGNLARPFYKDTLFNGYPTRANIENFLKLVKQDYSYALARYFAEQLEIIYEDLQKVINTGE
jgi:hypothetical protein